MSKEFHSLRVKQVKRETEDTVSVCFDIPTELKEKYLYTQGQYLTLRFHINGKEERRAYSMSSSPLEEDITVTVKRLKSGLISNHIHDQVKEGTEIEVMQPDGRFYSKLSPDHKINYFMFGAGSGITPLMSIASTIIEKEPMSKLMLLYGSRDEESIIFKDKLDQLEEKYKDQIEVVHILSRPKKEKAGGLGGLFKKAKTNWKGLVGRIDQIKVKNFLRDRRKQGKQEEYFVCGPGNMIDNVESSLLSLGVDKRNIHTERFVTASEAKSGSTDQNVTSGEGSKLTYTLNGDVSNIVIPKGKTILDTMIDLKLEPPYSCTSGACSTCMAKLTKGKVEMEVCYALDDDEVANGYILACQSHPQTAEVEINFDV